MLVELTSLPDITRLTNLDGPFVTAILPVPVRGDRPEELAMHWSSARHDLAASGAPEALLEGASEVVASLPALGRPVYVAAAEGTTAYRWLQPGAAQSAATFDALPDLLPVVTELQEQRVGVGVVIDHLGADVVVVTHRQMVGDESVDGSDAHVHLAASGGWSQRRHQTHTRLTWERNATLVAEELVRVCGRESPSVIAVSGDERSIGYLLDHLPNDLRPLTQVVAAGGRSDPDAVERLVDATAEAVGDVEQARRRGLVARLEQELGQHDQAVAGGAACIEALAAGSVATLVLTDGHDAGERAWFGPDPMQVAMSRADLEAMGVTDPQEGRLVDVAIRAALGSGAEVLPVDTSLLPSGIPSPAALLRF